jgi:predicted protein tyrosine phosphatase
MSQGVVTLCGDESAKLRGAAAEFGRHGLKRVLFLCGKNRKRSPTAEAIFAGRPDLEVRSAGLDHDSDNLCTPEDIEWADVIFVMEKSHRTKLARKFKAQLRAKVICLNIKDDYRFMEPELITRLSTGIGRHLPSAHSIDSHSTNRTT